MRSKAALLLAAALAGAMLWKLLLTNENPTAGFGCLADTVFFEAANQSLLGKEMVAYVVLARAKDNRREFGGSTICGVVYKKYGRAAAFSWTLLPQARLERMRARDPSGWAESLRVARLVLNGEFVPPSQLLGVRYYKNDATADRHASCWFERHLFPVASIGDHRFYREPKDASERAAIELLKKQHCLDADVRS